MLLDPAFNNQPVISFGDNDALITPFDAQLNTNEFTTFIVMCSNNDNNNYQGGFESRGFGGNRRGYNIYANMSGSNNRWEFWVGEDTSWNNVNAATGSAVVNEPNLLTMFIQGGNGAGATVTAQTLRVDGEQVATATPNYHKNINEPTQVGRLNDASSCSTFPLIGKVAEVIKYDRTLSSAEIEQVEAYLARKYNLAISKNVSTHAGRLSQNSLRPVNKGIDRS